MTQKPTLRAEDVIDWVDAHWGIRCSCGQALIGHDAVLSLLLGHKAFPRCLPCLAEFMGEEPGAFVQRSLAHLGRLDCYRAGWEYADRRLSTNGQERPAYLPQGGCSDPSRVETFRAPALVADGTWDAGDMGCGDLVLELRTRLAELEPGAVLAVHATDPGAPEDLPAWCRITKNELVRFEHPHYWIQRRALRVDS
jgi:tRNA 2-thiouridine synthesizing protein A